MQIVAVVFCDIELEHYNLIPKEKPYFYLDPVETSVGDYALIHNGQNFSVCRVCRIIPTTDPVAVSIAYKPILCRIPYNPSLLKDIGGRLEEYKARTSEHRIQAAIDKVLGNEDNAKKIADQTPRAEFARSDAIGEPREKPSSSRLTHNNDLDDEIPF